jgi:hypothetical protein
MLVSEPTGSDVATRGALLIQVDSVAEHRIVTDVSSDEDLEAPPFARVHVIVDERTTVLSSSDRCVANRARNSSTAETSFSTSRGSADVDHDVAVAPTRTMQSAISRCVDERHLESICRRLQPPDSTMSDCWAST